MIKLFQKPLSLAVFSKCFKHPIKIHLIFLSESHWHLYLQGNLEKQVLGSPCFTLSIQDPLLWDWTSFHHKQNQNSVRNYGEITTEQATNGICHPWPQGTQQRQMMGVRRGCWEAKGGKKNVLNEMWTVDQQRFVKDKTEARDNISQSRQEK